MDKRGGYVGEISIVCVFVCVCVFVRERERESEREQEVEGVWMRVKVLVHKWTNHYVLRVENRDERERERARDR